MVGHLDVIVPIDDDNVVVEYEDDFSTFFSLK
jgi:hypothetical protein